jgi:hypothetical protein
VGFLQYLHQDGSDKLLIDQDALLRQSANDAFGRGVQAEAVEGEADCLFLRTLRPAV